jgi:hypothetical protein
MQNEAGASWDSGCPPPVILVMTPRREWFCAYMKEAHGVDVSNRYIVQIGRTTYRRARGIRDVRTYDASTPIVLAHGWQECENIDVILEHFPLRGR